MSSTCKSAAPNLPAFRPEDWRVQSSINELPEIGFVRERQVLRVFPVSRSTWWNGIRNGKYPKPVTLSERITAWRVSDIRALIEVSSRLGGIKSDPHI
jgi:prophage regulatory protein